MEIAHLERVIEAQREEIARLVAQLAEANDDAGRARAAPRIY
jgi:hypothetical protein